MNRPGTKRRRNEETLRAVIDIGSNTVRLVVFADHPRVPTAILNEKVTARLGRDLSTTRKLPDKAVAVALEALERFAVLIADLEIESVTTVATAAVRESDNGEEFLRKVQELGFAPRLLSGEEEAIASAYGVIGAFPCAEGLVADLGGGSLELVTIADNEPAHASSLALGTLRLPDLRGTARTFDKTVECVLTENGRSQASVAGPLYLVGGTWRALATFAIAKKMSPLNDPHGFSMTAEEALQVIKKLSRTPVAELCGIERISATRASALPDAAALLHVLLKTFSPPCVVFSAWGLREGLLFQNLSTAERKLDPLLTGVATFSRSYGVSAVQASMAAAWTAPLFSESSREKERIRRAAVYLSLAASRLEPNLRGPHALDWALKKRWVGLSHAARGQLASAMCAFCGSSDIPKSILGLAVTADLREAFTWGLAARLCRRVGAGSKVSMLSSGLHLTDENLILWLDADRSALANEGVQRDLAVLASALGRTPLIESRHEVTG